MLSDHTEKQTGKLPQMNNRLCLVASVLFTSGPHRDLCGSKTGAGLGIARKQQGDGGRTGPPVLDARATYPISFTTSSPPANSTAAIWSPSLPMHRPVTLSFSFCLLALYQLLHPCVYLLTQCSHPHCCLLTAFFPGCQHTSSQLPSISGSTHSS